MKTFIQYLNESDLEAYRQKALDVIHAHSDKWKSHISNVLGTSVSHIEPHGSVLHPDKFHEGSDIDILAHTHNKTKPHGIDSEASEKLSGLIYHQHLGHVDVGVFNHNKETHG